MVSTSDQDDQTDEQRDSIASLNFQDSYQEKRKKALQLGSFSDNLRLNLHREHSMPVPQVVHEEYTGRMAKTTKNSSQDSSDASSHEKKQREAYKKKLETDFSKRITSL